MGAVRVPNGIRPETVSVQVHPQGISEAENAWNPLPMRPVAKDGRFEAICTSPTLRTVVEFTGGGIRRAQFAWPVEFSEKPPAEKSPADNTASDKAIAVFPLERGAASAVEVRALDAATSAPIAGARLGTIRPSEDIASENLVKTYPFFVDGGADGRLNVTGLLPGQGYSGIISAPGYVRRRVRIEPGARAITMTMRPGGASLSGRLVGEKSGRAYPGKPVLLEGGLEDFHILRLTDSSGGFAFDGLPAGLFDLAPYVPEMGIAPRTAFKVEKDQSLHEITLFMPEGIRIEGRLEDAETGEGVPGAFMRLGNQSRATDSQGGFFFEGIRGPWPIRLEIDHPDYEFLESDQDPNMYPINGVELRDLAGVTLKLQKRRYLEVICEASDETAASALANKAAYLEIRGPWEISPMPPARRERLAKRRTVLPLGMAGTRALWIRTAGAPENPMLASEIAWISTPREETTTTVRLSLGRSAALEGSLTYSDGAAPPPVFRVSIQPIYAPDPTSPNLIAAPPSAIFRERIILLEAAPDVGGAFRFDGLPAGLVKVMFMRGEEGEYLSETVMLAKGETARIYKTIERGVRLAGRVTDESVKARESIPISLYGKSPEGGALHVRVFSDSLGHFSADNFGGPALERLQAEYHGFEPAALENIPLPNEEIVVVMRAAGGLKVIVHAPPDALADGAVWAMIGRPSASEVAPGQWTYQAVERISLAGESQVQIRPDARGRYRIAAQAGGVWDVSPAFDWNPAAPRGPAAQGPEAGGAAVVERQSIELTPGHRSSLRVSIEGPGAASAEEIQFMLMNTSMPEGSDFVMFEPSERGGAEIRYDDLPAGEYMLIATSSGGIQATRTNIDVPSGGQAEVTQRLEAAYMDIAGRVMLKAKSLVPVEGARVVLRFGDVAEAEPLAETRADSDGRFEFQEIPAERPYLVEAYYGEHFRQVRLAAQAGAQAPQARETGEASISANRTRTVEIIFDNFVTVKWEIGEKLQKRLDASAAGTQIVFQEVEGARSAVWAPRAPDSECRLMPGKYRVSLGEEPLGEIEIPTMEGPARLSLPEPE